MRKDYWSYKEEIPNLKMKYDKLNGECSSLEQTIDSHNQTLSVSKELEAMEFDPKVLKLLRNTINKAAFANNIPADQAVQKFCKDIEEQYDAKLGFELKLNKVRSEIDIVTTNLNIAREALRAQPVIGFMLQRLFEEGIREQDIIDVAKLFERSNNVDKEALLDGLMKYHIVKTIIKKLNQQVE